MIVLPFPSSKLSGQHNAHHWVTRPIINAHREAACEATKDAGVVIPPQGDIRIHVRFVPPDRRGDRVNFPNRMKAYFDGVADALGVNDSRFLPSYEFADPEKPGRVEITVGDQVGDKEPFQPLAPNREGAEKKSAPNASWNSTSGADQNRIGAAK